MHEETYAWHPIRCLTRSDGNATTLFHSFYLIDKIDLENMAINVALQIPSGDSLKSNNVHAGLPLFVLEAVLSIKKQLAAEEVAAEALAAKRSLNAPISASPPVVEIPRGRSKNIARPEQHLSPSASSSSIAGSQSSTGAASVASSGGNGGESESDVSVAGTATALGAVQLDATSLPPVPPHASTSHSSFSSTAAAAATSATTTSSSYSSSTAREAITENSDVDESGNINAAKGSPSSCFEIEDHYGSFVITGENAGRHYCFWRGNAQRVFVAASAFPCMTFARNIFDLLGLESTENLLGTLTGLCETPLLPACGLQYEILFSDKRKASIQFNTTEQVDDLDMFTLATHMLHPSLIVAAWEAIMLERKVLVKSATHSLIAPCCDFFRRLVYPYVLVHTYVPVLSEQLINTIEAPFPYLVGADSAILDMYPYLDLSDTVIIDLDRRCVDYPSARPDAARSAQADVRAPKALVDRLCKEISETLLQKFDLILRRPFVKTSVLRSASGQFSNRNQPIALPLSLDEVAIREANAILNIFIRENIALVSARNNFLSYFIRTPRDYNVTAAFSTASSSSGGGSSLKRQPASDLGYELYRGLACGYFQLLESTGRMPVWVEASRVSIEVYQYADQLPYILMRYKDIESILKMDDMDPVGFLIRIKMKNGVQLLFQVQHEDARPKWYEFLNKSLLFAAQTDYNGSDMTSHSSGKGGDTGDDKFNNALGNQSIIRDPDMSELANAVRQTDVGDSDKHTAIRGDGVEDLFFPVESSGKSSSSSSSTNASPRAADGSSGGSGHGQFGSSAAAMTPEQAMLASAAAEERERIEKGEKQAQLAEERAQGEVSLFRAAFLQTQMMSFVESVLLPDSFETMLNKLGLTFEESYVAELDCNSFRDKYISRPDGPNIQVIVKATIEEYKSRGEIWNMSQPKTKNQVVAQEGGSSNKAGGGSQAGSDASGQLSASSDGSGGGSKDGKQSTSRGYSSFFGSRRVSVTSAAKPDSKSGGAITGPGGETIGDPSDQREKDRMKLSETRDVLEKIVNSYRICVSEIRSTIVEDRMEVLASLVNYHENVIAGAKSTKPITVSVLPTSAVTKQHTSSVLGVGASAGAGVNGGVSAEGTTVGGSATVTSTSSDSEAPTTPNRGSGSGSGSGKSWMSHMWDGLIPHAADKQDRTGFSAKYQQLRRVMRADILQQIAKQFDADAPHLHSPLHTCASYIHMESKNIENALRSFSRGKMAAQANIMMCLCMKFVELAKQQTFSTPAFIEWANDFGPLIGLQAYRLVMYLMWKHVQMNFSHMANAVMDDSLMLDSKSKGIFGATKSGDSGGLNSDRSGMSKNNSHEGVPSSSYTFVINRGKKSGVLNESVLCTQSVSAAQPVGLSIYLATKVRDILNQFVRDIYLMQEEQNDEYADYLKSEKEKEKKDPDYKSVLRPKKPDFITVINGRYKLDVSNVQIQTVLSKMADVPKSPNFKIFEEQVCELQRVDIKTLRNNNQLVVFFVNIFNTLMLHAILKNGSPGNSVKDRSAFMTKNRYMIGTGITFSLIEIEQAILRHKSKKANIFGYLQDDSFSESDNRCAFRLSIPVPFITFVLYTATDSSPPLLILKDPDNLDEELQNHAKEYIKMYARSRRENFTANVPGILRVYLDDFSDGAGAVTSKSRNPNPSKMFMKLLIYLAPDRLKSELEAIFIPKADSIAVPRLLFDTINWTPHIIGDVFKIDEMLKYKKSGVTSKADESAASAAARDRSSKRNGSVTGTGK